MRSYLLLSGAENACAGTLSNILRGIRALICACAIISTLYDIFNLLTTGYSS